jgi:hypothetical protein
MLKIVTTAKGVKTEHQIEDKPGGFTCIVHDQGLRVDVPEFVEINAMDTIETMASMNQKQWEWISGGELFQTLWNASFDANHRSGKQDIPQTIEELNQGDYGLIHVAGMIVMGCEAMFDGHNVFFRNPETHLHPSSERMIVDMFKEMINLCGFHGVVTKTDTDPIKIKNTQQNTQPQNVPTQDVQLNKEQTLKWLHCMEPEKQFAKIGESVYTVADLILEVTQDTSIGVQLIDLFVNKRDGNAD